MTLSLVLAAIGLAFASGFVGLFLRERAALAVLLLGSLAGVAAAVDVLRASTVEATFRWLVPGGALAVRVDALAAMFLLQIFVIAALGAIYALRYWADAEHPEDGRKVRVFYGVMVAGMATLVVAKNAILFLVGWEVMALAAFVLVSAEDRLPRVRKAGLVYLLSTRVGTLCLFAFFALLRATNGSFALDAPIDGAAPMASVMFVLALLGFGLKAGAMPLHIWLPEAHANAPSHVSALMSGVLIKMGIYGLLRYITWVQVPPTWWGTAILTAGIVSGVLGVAFAIGQHDLKRLLAYHSVENIGIILIGLGIGLLGRARGDTVIFVLGVGGALLHVWNHGIFKALLFLSAGSVLHATGTREIDLLGGLGKRMPWTAGSFVVGAVAISGLPPLNGFISELLIYLALLRACAHPDGTLFAAGAIGAPALALIGALAVACFVKVYGAVFLGAARSGHGAKAHEAPTAMLGPMLVLVGLCLTIGLLPMLVSPVLDSALGTFAVEVPRIASLAPWRAISIGAASLLALLALGIAWTRRLPSSDEVIGTWDCGYAAPTARMQYTSSSFAAWVVELFSVFLRPERHGPTIQGLFPERAHFHSHVPEVVLDRGITPAFRLTGRWLASFRWIQRGSVHVYVVYIVAALVMSLLVFR